MKRVFKCLNFTEFIDEYKSLDIIPMLKIKEMQNVLKDRKICISEFCFNPHMYEYFFFKFIDIVKRNYKSYVINYSIYKEDVNDLTENYKGEILFDSRNENLVYLEFNKTLIDSDLNTGLDWSYIWDHACEGWIMNNIGYEIFKRYLNGETVTEEEIEDFIHNCISMFKYGYIHESIIFISFNDNLDKFIDTINFDFKDQYEKE